MRVGRIGRPHGNDGTFHVAEPTERCSLLDAGRRVWIGERELTIGRRAGTAKRPLLKLEGVDGRPEIEALGGVAITVPRTEIALGAGEHLVDDLISCEVRGDGRPIGRVRDVLSLPSVDALEVATQNGDTVLVPLVEDAVSKIDVEHGRIDVNVDFLQLRDARP